MEESRADLVLHPIRWRIIQALMGRELTTSGLRERLADIPVTTLYRQVAILAEAEVLHVVAERRVRGTVERTYALRMERPTISDSGELGPEQLRTAFTAYAAGLLADFERYLGRDRIDPEADHLSFTQAALYLTEAELAELGAGMAALLTPFLEPGERPAGNDDAADEPKRRFMLSTIMLPGD
ncbi:helix-turn-helix domain-containing protein [Microlunatus speluncae]|uniref:helix-turn-helix domain-containing protein n=1 Tax=Microlunatus speluncae TaxID=2594267 RepID=UPI0012664774|nr:helix-turn-helix domain-containing protein [Microlunatus speluncae]